MKMTDLKSENTKKSLAKSLKILIKKKKFNKITINDIVKLSKVNRNTFYYHFEDINALLKWTFEQETFDFLKTFDMTTDFEKALNFIIDYVENNKHILNCVTNSLGREQMKQFFSDDLQDVVKMLINASEKELNLKVNDDFKKYLCNFYTEAIAGNLLAYFKNKETIDRKKIVSYISITCKNAIPLILTEANKKLQ